MLSKNMVSNKSDFSHLSSTIFKKTYLFNDVGITKDLPRAILGGNTTIISCKIMLLDLHSET